MEKKTRVVFPASLCLELTVLHSVILFPSVPGGGVPQGSAGGRPLAPRAALPLRLPLLQQRHRAPLPGQDAALHEDVFSLSRSKF